MHESEGMTDQPEMPNLSGRSKHSYLLDKNQHELADYQAESPLVCQANILEPRIVSLHYLQRKKMQDNPRAKSCSSRGLSKVNSTQNALF